MSIDTRYISVSCQVTHFPYLAPFESSNEKKLSEKLIDYLIANRRKLGGSLGVKPVYRTKTKSSDKLKGSQNPHSILPVVDGFIVNPNINSRKSNPLFQKAKYGQFASAPGGQGLLKLNAPKTSPGFAPTTSSSSTKIASVPTQAQEFNDAKPSFVMTRDEALNLIGETYPGQLEITANKRFSEWQAVKKIYHAIDFGINPKDYGMMKDDISRLNEIGLTKYVREGRPLPPIKLVNDYQMAVKTMCDHSDHSDGKFSSRGDQKIHETSYCYNESTRQVAAFNKETGDVITAGKYNRRAFDRFLETMHLGRL